MPAPSPRTATLVLVAATLVAYGNAFRGTFQFDDFAAILEDPHLESLSVLAGHLGHTIRPVLKLTLLVDRRLYGADPTGYHVLNLLLHVGSGLLVYRLLARFRDRDTPDSLPGGLATLPFWAALLFLLHPLATETVTYLSGRATGLMAFLYLLSLDRFLAATDPGKPPGRARRHYRVALLSSVLALLSKETAVTLPAALWLCEATLRRRDSPAARAAAVRAQLPFWGVVAAFLALVWLHPRYAYLVRYSLALRPLGDNLVTQLNTVPYAVSLLLPARLSFDHDLPVSHSPLAWPTPLSVGILLAMVWVARRTIRAAPPVAFGVLWFLLHLIPTNSVLPRYDLLSERNLYLPSVGLFAAFVSGAILLVGRIARAARALDSRVPPGARLALRALPVLGAALLALSTVHRNALYADPVALWSDAVRKSPLKARAHTNLGHAYFQQGSLEPAIDEFRTALALDPDHEPARRNLLRAWLLRARVDGIPP